MYSSQKDTAPLFERMVGDIAFKRQYASLWKQANANLDSAAMDHYDLAYDIH